MPAVSSPSCKLVVGQQETSQTTGFRSVGLDWEGRDSSSNAGRGLPGRGAGKAAREDGWGRPGPANGCFGRSHGPDAAGGTSRGYRGTSPAKSGCWAGYSSGSDTDDGRSGAVAIDRMCSAAQSEHHTRRHARAGIRHVAESRRSNCRPTSVPAFCDSSSSSTSPCTCIVKTRLQSLDSDAKQQGLDAARSGGQQPPQG